MNERSESSGITPERSDKNTLTNSVSSPDQAIQQARDHLRNAVWDGDPTMEQYSALVNALLSASRASLEEEIANLLARAEKAETVARLGIEADNHHNAACCPYCQPDLEKQATRNRELRERAERAEAALQSRPSQEWHPIKTAKRDVDLWCYDPIEGYYAGRLIEVQEFLGVRNGTRPALRWHNRSANRYSKPTHWMPLPPAPEGK